MRQVSRLSRLALLTVALLAGSALSAGGAAAATTNPANLGTSIAPSVPSDPVLHGVTAGGAPWIIKQSTFQLLPDGQVVAVIRGLVIPELGTPGPVTSVDAALYCGNETTATATTQSVPLSEQGNAVIVSRVTLPATCLAPAVLIHPNGINAIYIATSGFSAPSSSALDPVLLSTSIAPSVPSDPMLHGVTAGGAPWVIKPSEFQLLANGQVVAVIRGLVIPELGTPGPVTSVDAALYCGNDTTPAATTQSVPLSEQGNAVIVSRVSLPATCLAPAVLINPNGINAIYIATSGFGG